MGADLQPSSGNDQAFARVGGADFGSTKWGERGCRQRFGKLIAVRLPTFTYERFERFREGSLPVRERRGRARGRIDALFFHNGRIAVALECACRNR